MISLDELATLITPLQTEWPQSKFDAERLKLWHSHFERKTAEEFTTAVHAWIGQSKYFPKVAEIRNLIPSTRGMPQVKSAPRVTLTDLEHLWRAVQGAYAMWVTGRSMPSDDYTGSLMTREEITAFVRQALVPPEKIPEETKVSTLELHRIAFGELRRSFEDMFSSLPQAVGRTSHPFCECSRCEREIKNFGTTHSATH